MLFFTCNLHIHRRVIETLYSDGLIERFSYNLLGALTEASNPYTTVRLAYDWMGRVTKEWRDAYWVESRYDELGSRVGMTSSLGASLTLERDGLGQVSRMEATVGDNTGNPWTAQVQYNALGQEIERLLPGEVISSWQYDAAGRAERHSVKTGGRESRRRSYNWDINNRLKSITDNLTNKQTSFLYDDFGTLIGSAGFDRLFRMSDNVGNLYSSGHKTDRKYGVGGQLLEFDGIRYSYDEEGNLIEKIEADGTNWRYEYFGNGMMSKVVRPDGREVTFTYDSLGRRIEKEYDGLKTTYVWDGNTILHEWKDEPQAATTWIFDEGTFQPAAKLTPEGRFSIVNDHLGTPVEMYDEQGERVWAAELDIYGNVQWTGLKGNRLDCPFRYQGQYEDEETGLYYNRFRYYSPYEGMYTQQDPIGLAGGLSLYSYTKDSNTQIDIFGWKDIVYRALSEMDMETVKKGLGITPKNPSANSTPLEHVLNGSTSGYGDQYISFTRDEKFANRWASKSGTSVVSVDLDELHNRKIDLSTPEGRITHLGDASRVPKGHSIHTANKWAKGASEVLVEGGIPGSAIIDCHG